MSVTETATAVSPAPHQLCDLDHYFALRSPLPHLMSEIRVIIVPAPTWSCRRVKRGQTCQAFELCGHVVRAGHYLICYGVGRGRPLCGTEETGSERDLACPGLHSTGCFLPTGYTAPYLTVFSENSIDVFDVRRAEWVQTVPLKKVRPDPEHGSGAGSGTVGWAAWPDLCVFCLR